jgi:hypothetical protein
MRIHEHNDDDVMMMRRNRINDSDYNDDDRNDDCVDYDDKNI